MSDRAGNSASAGASVLVTGAVTQLVVSPTRVTLVLGQTRALKVADRSGAPVTGVTWTTSNGLVATVTTDPTPAVVPVGPGQATITAALGERSADVLVTVVDGVTLAPGTVEWAAEPPAGFWAGGIVYTHRTDPNVPDLYAFEYVAGTAGAGQIYRGLTSEGEVVRVDLPPLSQDEYVVKTIGETFGGLVVAIQGYVWDGTQWVWHSAIARFAGPPGVLPWRYDSPGGLDPERMAQGSDGTIYAFEQDSAGYS